MPGGSSNSGEESYRTPLNYRETEDLAASLNLSSGEVIPAYVESILPGKENRLLLNIKGRKVVAQSKPEVQPGDSLVVKVVSTAHPIELKIFAPEEAESELNRDELNEVIKSMGLSPTDRLHELARELLNQDIHLDAGLLEKASSNWAELTDQSGQLQSGRVDALTFLYSRKLPAKNVLLQTLGHMPEASGNSAWSGLGKRASFQPIDADFNLREKLLGLGIDVVRQFTRRPQTAANTLHSELLRACESGQAEASDQQLLALLLGLGLSNFELSEEYNLLLPFVENGQLKQLQILARPEAIPEGWKEPNWSAQLFVKLDACGRIEVQVRKNRQQVEINFCNSERSVINRLENRAGELARILRAADYEVKITCEQTEPAVPPDPLANTRADQPDLDIEGVDFLV